jgi:hypothetical protein
LKPVNLFTWPCHPHNSSCAIDEYGRFRIDHPFDWLRELALHALGGVGACRCLNVLARYRSEELVAPALRYRRGLPPLPDCPWPNSERPPKWGRQSNRTDRYCRPFLRELSRRVVEVLRRRGWNAATKESDPNSSPGVRIFSVIEGKDRGVLFMGGGLRHVSTNDHSGWSTTFAPSHPRIVNAVAAFCECQFFICLRALATVRSMDRDAAWRLRLLSDYCDLLQNRSLDKVPLPLLLTRSWRCAPQDFRRELVRLLHRPGFRIPAVTDFDELIAKEEKP